MNKRIIIKGCILVIILLINSIIIYPAIAIKTDKNENQNNNLFKITVRIYKSDQFQSHYVYLTEWQINKLDEVFKNIAVKQKNSKSLKDYNEILNYAFRSFKNLGLTTDNMKLKDVIQVLRTTMRYQTISGCLCKLKNYLSPKSKENLFCSIVGSTNGTHFFRNTGWHISINWPIALNNCICYGTYPFPNETNPYPNWSPAVGWVNTKGLLGEINWNGEFYGQIIKDYYISNKFYSVLGVRGFTGFRIEQDDNWIYYYGFAIRVKLTSEKPPDPKI